MDGAASRLTLTLVFAIVAGCGSSGQGADGHGRPAEHGEFEFRPLELNPVVTFGWQEGENQMRSLPEVEQTYGGGVLGNIAGVREGPSGSLYVLDRAWNKIVVFRPDGHYDRLILGGAGQGPGEFQIPRGLAVSPSGNLGVLDEARQVTVFSPAGELLHVVKLDGRLPLDIALDDSSVWVLHMTQQPGVHALLRYDLDTGALLEASGLADDTIATWMIHGESGAITLDGGNVIWALARTGVVRRITPGIEAESGTPIFPSLQPQTGVTPGGVPLYWVGEGVNAVRSVLGANWVLHRRTEVELDAWNHEYFLTRLDADFANPRYYTFGTASIWAAGFDISREGMAMYVATDEPYPRVEKHAIPR